MKTIIEIGANYGQHTAHFVNQNDTFVYSFEPLPILFNRLKETYKENNNIKLIQKAVSDFNGVSKFKVSDPSEGAQDYGSSSLNDFIDNRHELWPNRLDFEVIDIIDVDVIRMDTFIVENNINEIDYLHCDAQGNDLKVLKSFGDKIHILKEGVVEAANTVSLYKIDNTSKSIVDFLEENNFEIINKHDLQSSSYEIDIYFKRK